MYAAVLVVTTTSLVAAAPPWSEFGVAQPLRPAEQLSEASCEMSIEVRGTIAEVEMRQRVVNPGPAALAAAMDFELPADAQLIGMSLQRGRGKLEGAVAVTTWSGGDETVVSRDVLGPDPAILYQLGPHTNGRPHFRFIAQPIESEQEITVHTRWLAVADIAGGALRLPLVGRGDGAPACRVLAHVQPGPGASVARMRVDQQELGLRSTASFELGAADATLTAQLAFKRSEPLVWLQTQALGDGYTARAATVVMPPARSADARRALILIDGSRSMELVGRHNVTQLVRTLGSALPQKAEVEAVIFDRAQTRVLGAWKPATTETLGAIETAISKHVATNGSDTTGAFAFARQLIDGMRGQTMVIVVTDGVLGDVTGDALTKTLGSSPADLDLHVIALSPGRMRAPDAAALRTAVEYFGGSYLDVPTRDIDTALSSLDGWLRPAWQEIALSGMSNAALPDQLRAGEGVTIVDTSKDAGTVKLTARGDKQVTIAAAKGPKAQLAQLALADAGDADESARARLRERHVAVDQNHPLVVLSTIGTVAANRRAMVIGGGPYTRMVDAPDPKFPNYATQIATPVVIGGSAVDRNTVTLLLKQYLQPAAFVCYQRALAKDGSLAGTAKFTLEIGRGELTRASVVGIGNATFDSCLLDAAYLVTPPLPNPDINTDDRSIVNYPLTFSMREQKAFVLAGDADSSSPLDIDAIEGGVPVSARRGTIKAGDTSTPLGGLRPTPMK
jgi:hypothetical protein